MELTALKFLVFQGEDVQKRLHPIAYNQQQILDASAVVAILGDLEAYKNVEQVYGPIVEQGFMKEEAKERLAKILSLHMHVSNSQEMQPFQMHL